jgi:hypothetical protein
LESYVTLNLSAKRHSKIVQTASNFHDLIREKGFDIAKDVFDNPAPFYDTSTGRNLSSYQLLPELEAIARHARWKA